MKLPIGYDDFGAVIRDHLDFVDKTLFIKEVLDNVQVQVSLITRPRRFGKTLNLSMLQYFLAAEVDGQSTKNLFDGLKITEAGEQYLKHQGKYPVIFMTFKEVKDLNFDASYQKLVFLMRKTYAKYRYLLTSPHLSPEDKKFYQATLDCTLSPVFFEASLNSLTEFLYKHHGVRPWLLLDEYDAPIHAAFTHGYYEEMILLTQGLFGSALKSNRFLGRAVITGILRISKESLFSGLNNIAVYSLFNSRYGQHFGFTESEVADLLSKSHLTHLSEKIRYWYNGYQIGSHVIYNPWSIANCLNNQGELKTYWVNTSGNDLVKHLLAQGDETVKRDLEAILQEETITALLDEGMVFGDLEKDRDSIWGLLFSCGYLKAIHTEFKEDQIQCELAAPNQEVMALYRGIAKGWLSAPLGGQGYLEFLSSLTEGRIEEFTDRLQKYLLETASFFDVSGNEPERFYHGFVLGLIVSLKETHAVQSNRESGYGRYDVMLIPKDPDALGIILEFKTVRESNADLQQAAMQAVQQITEKQYEAVLRQKGIQHILKIGMAFHGKKVAVFSTAPVESTHLL